MNTPSAEDQFRSLIDELENLMRQPPSVRLRAVVQRLSEFRVAFAGTANEDFHPSPELVTTLRTILDNHGIFKLGLTPGFTAIFLSRLSKWEQEGGGLAVLESDLLIHSLLRAVDFWNQELELRLVALRQKILATMMSSSDQACEYTQLIISIAIQCDKSEYVWALNETEKRWLSKTTAEMEALNSGAIDEDWFIDRLLLLTMYQSPLQLAFAQRFFNENLRERCPQLCDLIDRCAGDHAAELNLALTFATEGDLSDETSARVALMYERSPYPRWTGSLGTSNPAHLSLIENLRLDESPMWNAASAGRIESILIAGCGTGTHPCALAIGNPDVTITAIDLSSRSLAYAKMRADSAHISNVTFRRQDILGLVDWDQQFDMVESFGVIHHMSDMPVGLRALVTRLRPGGVLRLGLYAKLSRQAVIQFRQLGYMGGSEISDEDIREVRAKLLHAQSDSPFVELLSNSDFYSMSGCRDLLFHEHESQYTIPEIRELLEDNSLRFIRFRARPGLIELYRQVLGPTVDPFDLDQWDAAERKFPPLFRGMYDIYAQLET